MSSNEKVIKRLNIYMDYDLYDKLKDYSERMHISVGSSVSVILSSYFESQKNVALLGSVVDLLNTDPVEFMSKFNKELESK